MMAAMMMDKDMAYQPAPLFSAENLRSFLRTVLVLAAILFAIVLAGKALSYVFPDVDLPRWVTPALYGFYVIATGLSSAWSAWRTDPQTLDFDASREVIGQRAATIFSAAIAALALLFAYNIYPE